MAFETAFPKGDAKFAAVPPRPPQWKVAERAEWDRTWGKGEHPSQMAKVAEVQGLPVPVRVDEHPKVSVKRPFAAATAEERGVITDVVLSGMAEGKTVEEMAAVIAAAEGWSELSAGKIRRWMGEEEERWQRYQKARKLQGQAFAEEALRVARMSTNQTAAQDRTLIETLKWAAARANPAEYGDRQVVEHAGEQTLTIKVEEDVPPQHVQRAIAERTAQKSLEIAQVVPMLPTQTGE